MLRKNIKKLILICVMFSLLCGIFAINASANSLFHFKVNQVNQVNQESELKIYFEARDEQKARILNVAETNMNLSIDGENENLEIKEVLPFINSDEKVAYIFMIDISNKNTSEKFESIRGGVLAFIEKMKEGSYASVVAFGRKTEIFEFTDDKAKISQIVNDLSWGDKETQLYGAITRVPEIIKSVEKSEGFPDRRVAILFSDGTNINSSYTKKEADNAFKEAGVSFYGVSFKDNAENTALAELNEQIRNSGGEAYIIERSRDSVNIFTDIYYDITDIYIAKAKIPEKYSGQEKNLTLSISIENKTIEDEFNVKFNSSANQNLIDEPTTTEPETETTTNITTETTTEEPVVPAIDPMNDDNIEEEKSNTGMLIAILAVPGLAIIGGAIFFIIKKVGKKPEIVKEAEPQVSKHASTVPISQHESLQSSTPAGSTRPIFTEYAVTIIETNRLKNVQKTYNVTINGEFKIGRIPGENNLVINDETVSGFQCVIKSNASGLLIANRSKNNKTIVQKDVLNDYEFKEFASNSTIEIGRTELVVQYSKR